MNYRAAVITVSDRGFRGEREDTSGPAVAQILEDEGYEVVYRGMVPDERDEISAELIKCCYEMRADLVVTTGGTGLSPRDVTPEATRDVIEKEIPAIPQAMLHYCLAITPRAMLSRAAAGVRGKTLIVNLPGSEKAAKENLGAVVGTFEHGIQMIGGGHH